MKIEAKLLILLILIATSGCATFGGDRTVNVSGAQIASKS